MKTLRKEVVASVELVEVKVSEDELAVFESALSYALRNLSDADVERLLGATRDEAEGLLDDLREISSPQGEPEALAEMAEKS
ncbi:MAG TPA: hypothetical protein VJ866_05200 [Pyrinomonadaceae bacterium]|nr:hypothetical protein [Pyrinomonadaceae bacterium]